MSAAEDRTTRRSQEERSRTTRQRLLRAAQRCILEVGLRKTSTVMVADRAGVSRGALSHQFASRADLLRETLRDLLRTEVWEMQSVAEDVAEGGLTFDALIDRVWKRFSGPSYMISLEFVMAARTDPRIREVLQDIGLDYNETCEQVWHELVETRLGDSTPERRHAFVATLCLMRGMATQRIWREDDALFDAVLTFWKSALRHSGITEAAPEGQGS